MRSKAKPVATSANITGKDELIHQVAAKTGMTLDKTGATLDAFIEVVEAELARGRDVRLMGFGTWSVRHIAGRTVKSIRSQEIITVPASRRVGFKVGAQLAKSALRRHHK